MKLHLPVCLFRIVVALLASLSSSLYAEYAAPIYGEEHSILSLNDEHSITYSGYDVVGSGGAICGLEYSSIILNDKVKVTFSENSATVNGGAICGYDGSSIMLNDNVQVSFRENSALNFGGAIWGDDDSTITLRYNGEVTFSGNSSSSCGGAIYGSDGSTITLRDNGTVTFSENSATVYGGAIYGSDGCTIILSDNDIVSFRGNTSGGSAIYGSGGNTATLSNNGTVTFSGNSGGRAIIVSTTALNGNSTVTFSENRGGAISGGDITLNGNGEVTFSGNSSGSNGGAISGGDITLNGNGGVTFNGNLVSRSGYANGGAIYGDVTMSGNAEVTFCENKASSSGSDFSRGGAIYGDVTLRNCGSVIFSGNSADLGGAICDMRDTTLCDNGSVIFRGNSARDCGAICSGLVLSIRNNDFVLFEKNVEVNNGTYRLRSIYNSAGVGAVVSLSAAEEKSLEFRDPLYFGSSGKVELNADYTDAEGVVHKQQGDIIFTGKYTETHLNEILEAAEVDRTATKEEITNSRTTSVKSNTYLYGGRLRIEDGAILDVDYLKVADNSHATLLLKDGTIKGNVGLYGTNCYLTIGDTGTLSLTGENSISLGNRNLTMADGSCLRMELGTVNMDGNAVLSTTGTLNMDYITFVLADTEYLETGKYKLLTRTEGTDYDISGWTLQGAAANQLTWENGTLYYTGGHDWNHVVKGGDEVQDSYTGNLIVKDGSVTLDSSVTVNAVDGVEKTGHLVVDKEANLTVTAESSVRAEVIVKDGTLHNEGSMEDSITLMGGKVSGSGVFAGIDMTGGKLVVGNSPGMQRYTDTVNLSGGTVVFSVAGAEAASAGNSGWGSGTYSTLDMQGNILTFGEDVTIEVAFGGEGLVSVLTATDANPYTLQMELAQNVGNAAAYTQEVLKALASQTTFVVTEETSGIAGCITLAPGQSLADMVKSYSYSMSGDTLVLSVSLAGNGKGVVAVPEPTTATLSLLVLAALAARRRRK